MVGFLRLFDLQIYMCTLVCLSVYSIMLFRLDDVCNAIVVLITQR